MSVTCQIKDYKKLQQALGKMKKAPEAVLKKTLSDVKARAPAWISAEVAKQFGIKKAEVSDGKTGKLKIKGGSIESLTFTYSGRLLTPTHFGMTPKAPGQNAYTLKASIIKGQRTTMGKVKKLTKKQRAALGKNFRKEGTPSSDHSPIMLMHTGNTKQGGTDYIPFQRKSTSRNDVAAIKAISVPQMVSSERTAPHINEALNEGIGKRLDHHMNRYMGK